MSWLKSIILSILPISEVRGGIPYALASGIHPLLAIVILSIFNILIVPIVWIFLDYLHKYFLKIKIYEFLFNKYVSRTVNKVNKHVKKRSEYTILFLFTAFPFPLTGAYTSTLIAWIFKLKRKKSFFVISLGVVTASIIVSAISLGVISFVK